MSTGALQELRPRSPVELYDAALHLCVHTRSELPVLAVLGAAPLAASVLWLVWSAQHGHPILLACALTTAALVFRQMCQGAGGLAATRELEGEPLSAAGALRSAWVRLPSFVTCTLWLAILDCLGLPLTLGTSIFFLSAPLTGPVLIAEGSAHGWNFSKVARLRLRERNHAAAMLRILHAVALLLLMANLHGMLWLTLVICHSLFALDVSVVSQFASLGHGFYALCLFVTAELLLDPVRCATSTLLLADARVRREAFDLLAALRRLREPVGKAAAVLLVALAVGWARPAFAEPVESASVDPAGALTSIAEDLGVSDDPVVSEALDRAMQLPESQQAALAPLVRSLQREMLKDQTGQAAAELRAALAQFVAVSRRSSAPRLHPLAGGPRAAAQRILARPEFEPTIHREKKAKDPSQPPGWWTRFMEWLHHKLDKLLNQKQKPHPVSEPPGGLALGGGAAELLTYGLIALAVCVVLVLVYRLFAERSRKPEPPAGGAESPDGEGLAMDALAKPTWVWSSEADALAAEGRFREAIRSLYLAMLSALHRRGEIDYHPSLSNWAYCEAFRGPPSAVDDLREITRRFDFGWYGRIGADAEGYTRFRTLCGPLIQGQGQGGAEQEAARA